MSSNNSKKDIAYAALTEGAGGEFALAPVDKGSLAYIIMFYEGVGNLFPWNAFITAASYFAARFCGSAFSDNFENYFSFSYTMSQTIGLALSIKFQHSLSLRSKIIYPLMMYSLSFLVTTILVTVSINANVLFYVTLFQTTLCGICGAILSGGLFGLGAMFPPAYTGALMSGQGLAGLIVSLANVLTLLASDPVDECSTEDVTECAAFAVDYSALAYFIIATVILGFCGVAFFVLQGLSFTKYYMANDVNQQLSDPLLAPEVQYLDDGTESNPILGRVGDMDSDSAIDPETKERMQGHVSLSVIWSTFKTILIPAICVWATFSITIGLFPSLTVFMESKDKCRSNSRAVNDLFVPLQFLLFNLFDLVGRLTAGAIRPLFTAKNIWIPATCRLVFFPLFLLCNVSDSKLPVVFKSDFFPIFFMICFAFTNGYVASMCMMLGPTLVEKSNAALAGTIMVFLLTAGLLTGACLSFFTVLISQGSI